MDDALDDGIVMVDFEPEKIRSPRKRRSKPLEDVRLEADTKPKIYAYRGIRGGLLLAGYVK